MIFSASRRVLPMQAAYRVALAVCVLAIAYLAFTPVETPSGGHMDKVYHALAFAVMAWLAHGGFPGRNTAPLRWALLIGYGLVIELVQSQLPFRDFSLLDLLADLGGIVIYSLIASVTSRLNLKVRPAEG